MGTILIIEDELPIANLLKIRFEAEGFKAQIALSAAECLKKIMTAIPDAITLEITLPDCRGFGLLQVLKCNPKTAKVPIIVISSSDEAESAAEIGAVSVISKPIDFKRLLEVLKKVCGSK